MSKFNDKELQEILKDYHGTLALVFGRSVFENSAIRTAFVNKQLVHIGLGKVGTKDLTSLFNYIKEDPKYLKVYTQACMGRLTLDDLPVGENEEPITERGLYDIVTPYVADVNATRANINEFRKLQRETSMQKYIADKVASELVEAFKDYKAPIIKDTPKARVAGRTAVITPADWHIGSVIDNVEGNTYNHELFKIRLEEYIQACKAYVTSMNCDNIVLVHLGDIVEGIDMRKINQPYETEMTATKQISVATRVFVDMILELAHIGLPMRVGGVGGNHDRYTSNKKEAIYGDNIMYNIIDTLLILKESKVLPDNVEVIDNRDNIYEINLDINGSKNVFVHGDNEKKGNPNRIAKYISNEDIHNIWFGHYHSFLVGQEAYARLSIMSGSIMGFNSYSKTIGAPSTRASQLITILGTVNGTPEKITIPVFFTV